MLGKNALEVKQRCLAAGVLGAVSFATKPQIVALNKIDQPDVQERLKTIKASFKKKKTIRHRSNPKNFPGNE